MKSLLTTTLAAASIALLPAAAFGQATTPSGAGVAVFDPDAAIGNAAAFQAANTQIQASYKTQITAFQTRQAALQGELNGLRTEIETLPKNPATPKATLDAKINAFQSRGQAAQAELQRLALPFAKPQAYAREQIEAKLELAVKNAMTAKRIGILIRPEATWAVQPASDLSADVTAQLNALVPSASITPPANWQPGQGGQQAPAAAGR